jgi:hypothetical protein
MLWYKAWLETRSRFILALVGCTALCSMWIVEFGKQIESFKGVAGLFNLFHMIHGVLAFVWILSVILLMMVASYKSMPLVRHPSPSRCQ